MHAQIKEGGWYLRVDICENLLILFLIIEVYYSEHAFDSNHPISDDSFKILSNSTVFDLKVLESLYIHKLQPNLNDYNSSFDLYIVK